MRHPTSLLHNGGGHPANLLHYGGGGGGVRLHPLLRVPL
jgi:hypothetical protein